MVDLDLEKFYDRVNHDGLMARVAARVTADARNLLAPIYGWFTEGFDTADLKEA